MGPTYGFSGDGGPAVAAALSDTKQIAADLAGNLYFTDSDNHRVRKVTAAGIVTTIAGNGISRFSGDGGPAAFAQLGFAIKELESWPEPASLARNATPR